MTTDTDAPDVTANRAAEEEPAEHLDESASTTTRAATVGGGTQDEKVDIDKKKTDTDAKDATPATDSGVHPAASSRLRRAVTGRGLVTTVLAVVALVATVAAGVLGWQVKTQHDVETAGRAAQDAAEHFAVALTSIDSTSLDGDFAAVLDGATGPFKEMYGQAGAQLKQLLVDNKATGQGTVVDSAVKSADTDRAEILLFVDQTVTNSASPEPRIDRSRVLMTMERVDGRWLAAQVTLP